LVSTYSPLPSRCDIRSFQLYYSHLAYSLYVYIWSVVRHDFSADKMYIVHKHWIWIPLNTTNNFWMISLFAFYKYVKVYLTTKCAIEYHCVMWYSTTFVRIYRLDMIIYRLKQICQVCGFLMVFMESPVVCQPFGSWVQKLM
jgi:hypothetical protein